MLKLVALRIGARLVLDWTSWAAIALAVVLANSGVEHLRPDAALLRLGPPHKIPRVAPR